MLDELVIETCWRSGRGNRIIILFFWSARTSGFGRGLHGFGWSYGVSSMVTGWTVVLNFSPWNGFTAWKTWWWSSRRVCHYVSAKTVKGLDYPPTFSIRVQLYSAPTSRVLLAYDLYESVQRITSHLYTEGVLVSMPEPVLCKNLHITFTTLKGRKSDFRAVDVAWSNQCSVQTPGIDAFSYSKLAFRRTQNFGARLECS